MFGSSEKYIELFEASFLETITHTEMLESLRHDDVVKYRTKTYRMKNIIECEIYPVWNTRTETQKALRAKEMRPAQEKLNFKNTQKKITRLINNNFDERDIWITLGYSKNDELPTAPQAKKDVTNYLRRIDRQRKKAGLPKLRYLYVTEFANKKGEAVRPHHHIVLSGDMPRDVYEQAWKKGAYPQARRLQPDEQGLTGLGCYLSKGKSYQRTWAYSKNLKQPTCTIADKKVTKRQVEKIAISHDKATTFFETAFKGYNLIKQNGALEIKHSEFVAGAYIFARLHKTKINKTGSEKNAKTKQQRNNSDYNASSERRNKGGQRQRF